MNHAIIFIIGFITLLWGGWVMMPWTVFTHSSIYTTLALIAPEIAWGIISFISGLLIIVGALVKCHPKMLSYGALTAGWHWTMLTVSYVLSDPFHTGWIVALGMALLSAAVYLNAKLNL